jgi:predicted nuclease of restriction endonuclease-like (RecB) superfamily
VTRRGIAKRESVDPGAVEAGYAMLLADLTQHVRAARVRAHVAVNNELLLLYWRIGSTLSERRASEVWGSKVAGRLANDLRREFPDMTGLSVRNLAYMKSFAEAWPSAAIVQQPVAQLPWGHVTVLMDKLNDQVMREWYAAQAVMAGWSRAVLLNQIKSRLHERIGAAPTNFDASLPDESSELTAQLVKDPYHFGFLAMTGRLAERDLEQRLMTRIQDFLLELGDGFALYKRQHRFAVGSKEFVIDLVFFNVLQSRFVILELKVDEFEPAHLGQLQFYVEWAERHLRRPHHLPTVGILLVADKDDVVVRYALAASTSPLAVATYTYDKLPSGERSELPSNDRLRKAMMPPSV